MTSKPRCVFDTNSLISALLVSTSVSRKAFDKALNAYQVLISDETVAEFDDVAGREKFEPYITAEEREGFEERLHREARFVEVTERLEACRDPDDDKFLELAIAGGADILISGDNDLLVLDPFQGVRIVSPRSFVEEFPPLEETAL